jgi:hypothetical protein
MPIFCTAMRSGTSWRAVYSGSAKRASASRTKPSAKPSSAWARASDHAASARVIASQGYSSSSSLP